MLLQEFIGMVETDGESKVSFNYTHLKKKVTTCHAIRVHASRHCLLLSSSSYMHSSSPPRGVHPVLVPRL